MTYIQQYLPASLTNFFNAKQDPTIETTSKNTAQETKPEAITSAYSLAALKQYYQEADIPTEYIVSTLLALGIPLTMAMLYRHSWLASTPGILNPQENAAQEKAIEITTFALQGLRKEFTQFVNLLRIALQSGTVAARKMAMKRLHEKIASAAVAAQSMSPGSSDFYKKMLLSIIEPLGAAVGLNNDWYLDLKASTDIAFKMARDGWAVNEIYNEIIQGLFEDIN